MGNQTNRKYLTPAELSAHTGLSTRTIYRLKDQEKIPYHQPGGKGGRVLFPLDAIECRARDPGVAAPDASVSGNGPTKRLSGPSPGWMKTSRPNDNSKSTEE